MDCGDRGFRDRTSAEHDVDSSSTRIDDHGRFADRLDIERHLFSRFAPRACHRFLAPGKQSAGHAPPAPVRVAHEQHRIIGALDDRHGPHRERRVEPPHREPTRGPREATERVQEKEMGPAQHPLEVKRPACGR